MNYPSHTLLTAVVVLALDACSGYDRLFLVTKTNVGLDIDTKPPTAEISIARRELAIQPTFKNSQQGEGAASTLPLIAAFGIRTNDNKMSVLNPQITGTFAGGRAAMNLTRPTLAGNGEQADSGHTASTFQDDGMCLMTRPEPTLSILERVFRFLTTGDPKAAGQEANPRPFYFATDTSYGLKVAWSGTAGPYPDSVKLGYNRKEFASAPIFVNEGCPSLKPSGEAAGRFQVHAPSFFAAIDNASAIEGLNLTNNPSADSNPGDKGATHLQFIATGRAADQITGRPSVRDYYFAKFNPDAARSESDLPKLNNDLLGEIDHALEAPDAQKKPDILARAKALGLVPHNTDLQSLHPNLAAQAAKTDPGITHRLYLLRNFATEAE